MLRGLVANGREKETVRKGRGEAGEKSTYERRFRLDVLENGGVVLSLDL